MTRDNFVHLCNALTRRRHWKPYTLELLSGSRIEVNHPESITLGKDLFAVQASSGVVNYLEYGAVVRFINETGVG